jgi:hypothetical protein
MGIANLVTTVLSVAATALGGGNAPGRDGGLEPRVDPASAARGCALAIPHSKIGPQLDGCTTIFSDTASKADPEPVWGQIACQKRTRQSRPAAGGDPSPRADGGDQGNTAYRRLVVRDGDDFYGERCELGENDHDEGPTALYPEGARRATYASVRLPADFPIGVSAWQNVIQMKQTQPADNGGGTPALSLKAYGEHWILFHSDPGKTKVDTPLWSAPAEAGVWTRFAFDVRYSQDPDLGSIKLYADLDADGDFEDPGEESPTFITNTLKRETSGDSGDGYTKGASLRSHLRAGIYHDSEVECSAPATCAVEIDNVQVLRP